MAEFKLVISTKDGKSMQRDVKDNEAKPFLGKKIGDKISGDAAGMPGYEFELRGGSDASGFPMRKDITGTGRKRILALSGVGLKKKRKGQRQRKTVCGNTIHGKISQINLKVLKAGKSLDAPAPEAKEEAPKEEVKEEKKAPKEEKKEEKAEKKPEEKKEEPKEEAKEEKPEEKAEEKKEEQPEEKKEEPKEEEKKEEAPEEEKKD